MSALNPMFLWLLPLAALPVLFHLFFRVRKRMHPFSTLMFFLKADPRLSARKRIREWLALLLRVLAVLFLLLAMARLVWMGAGSSGSVGLVFVIDNSASMSASAPGGRSGLDHAIGAAAGLVAEMRPEDAASILLLVDDPSVSLPPPWTSDHTVLRAALDRILPTEAAGTPARVLDRVSELLNKGPAIRNEVHVLSDFQLNEWARSSTTTRAWRPGTALHAHRIGAAPRVRGNVTVRESRRPRRRLLAGRRLSIPLDVVNTSSIDAAVRLHNVDDSGERGTRDLPMAAFQSRSVNVALRPATAGMHWLNAWVEEDGFDADNSAFVAFGCSERETVTFVGPPSAFGMLPLALSPGGDGVLTGLSPQFTTAGALAEAFEAEPVMIITTWGAVATGTAELEKAVRNGAVALVVPGVNEVITPGTAPAWTGAQAGGVKTSSKGLPLIVHDKRSSLWRDMKNERGELLLGKPKVHRFFPLTTGEGAVSLLGLEDGQSLFTERPVGKGVVFMSGFAMDARWSTLPLHAAFLPMVHSMALLCPAQGGRVIVAEAGARVPELPSADESLHVSSVAGSGMDWQGRATDFPGFPRSGVYEAVCGEARLHIAVSSANGEGVAEFVTGEEVPALAGLKYKVTRFRDVATLVRNVKRGRSGVDMLLPMLLLCLAAVLVEGWLVNPPQRGRRGSAFRARTWLKRAGLYSRRIFRRGN